MASALNAFNCITQGGNTGTPSCAIDIKNIVGAIVLPSGLSFSPTNLLTEGAFLTALQAATLAPRATRAFPIHGFEEVTDSTEKAVIQTLGYGSRSVVREGYYDWMFQILKGGFCLLKSLRKFNNQNVDVLFVDANGLLFGLKVGTGDSATLRGVPLSYFYASPPTINNGAKSTIYAVQFVFPPAFIDSFGFVQLNLGDFDSVVGLQDIVLFSGGARVTNVSKVKGTFSCGGADLWTTYGTALNVAALWTVRDSVTGNYYDPSTGITSVAGSGTTSVYTITVSTSDPAYNAGNPVTIALALPSVLNAAGILAVESNSFTTPN